MSRSLKPNAQQIFGLHREAIYVAPILLFDPDSKFDKNNDRPKISIGFRNSAFSSNGNYFILAESGINSAVWFQPPPNKRGSKSHYSIVGVTKDSTGTPMAAVTLEGYTTSDDVIRGRCTSNAQGEYTLPTQVNAAHYIRAYKAGGAYNYGGTSDENLTPS